MSQSRLFTVICIFSLVVMTLASLGRAQQPAKIAQTQFTTFEPWSKPIEEYKTFAENWSDGEKTLADRYLKGIHDLAPHGEQMWFGYGDANLNLGTKMMDYGMRGIEFRYFSSPDNPVPYSAFGSGEEHLDRFRILDGQLWHAGIDSHDPDELTSRPGIQGNVYRLEDGRWLKFRTINGGEHVHDIAYWKGNVYAVGSGADDRMEWEGGNIFRYLWVSRTTGKIFKTAHRAGHPEQQGTGDTRYRHLLPLENVLCLFGYYSFFDGERVLVANERWDGVGTEPFDPAQDGEVAGVYAFGTQPLSDGSGLMWGISDDASDDTGLTYRDIRNRKGVQSMWHLDQSSKATSLTAFDNKVIADVFFHSETNELLYLVRDESGNIDSPQYKATIMVADAADPGSARELLTYTSDVKPVSIAFWKECLFLGMDNCQIYKAR